MVASASQQPPQLQPRKLQSLLALTICYMRWWGRACQHMQHVFVGVQSEYTASVSWDNGPTIPACSSDTQRAGEVGQCL